MISEGLVGLIGMVLIYSFGQFVLPNEHIPIQQELIKMDVEE
tara:strand:- start:811 stop:936 length:126 start_codon:yes stop_codon:yes gene_type:complete